MAARRLTALLDRPVAPDLVRLLCAVALSAPTKSDLQQRDIVLIEDKAQRRRLHEIVPGEGWERAAPAFLMICGNNRRQRQLQAWRGRPFRQRSPRCVLQCRGRCRLVLAAFVTAAEAVGLGCCPISAMRNRAQEVSDLLGLPITCFRLLAWRSAGRPATARSARACRSRRRSTPIASTIRRSKRKSPPMTSRRAAIHPYAKQRYVAEYGAASSYGWSEDKARQYSKPERADFGAFVRRKGFTLE